MFLRKPTRETMANTTSTTTAVIKRGFALLICFRLEPGGSRFLRSLAAHSGLGGVALRVPPQTLATALALSVGTVPRAGSAAYGTNVDT